MAPKDKVSNQGFVTVGDAKLSPAHQITYEQVKRLLDVKSNNLEVTFEQKNPQQRPDLVVTPKNGFELTKEYADNGQSPAAILAKAFQYASAEAVNVDGKEKFFINAPGNIVVDPSAPKNNEVQKALKEALEAEKQFKAKVSEKRNGVFEVFNEKFKDEIEASVLSDKENSYTIIIKKFHESDRKKLIEALNNGKLGAELSAFDKNGVIVVDLRKNWKGYNKDSLGQSLGTTLDNFIKDVKESRAAENAFVETLNNTNSKGSQFERMDNGAIQVAIQSVSADQVNHILAKNNATGFLDIKETDKGIILTMVNPESLAKNGNLNINLSNVLKDIDQTKNENLNKIGFYNLSLTAYNKDYQIERSSESGRYFLKHTFDAGSLKDVQKSVVEINRGLKADVAQVLAYQKDGNVTGVVVEILPDKLPQTEAKNTALFAETLIGTHDRDLKLKEHKVELAKAAQEKQKQLAAQQKEEAAKQEAEKESKTKLTSTNNNAPGEFSFSKFAKDNAQTVGAAGAGFLAFIMALFSGMGGSALIVGGIAALVGAFAGPSIIKHFTKEDTTPHPSNSTAPATTPIPTVAQAPAKAAPPTVAQTPADKTAENAKKAGLTAELIKKLDSLSGKDNDNQLDIKDLDKDKNGILTFKEIREAIQGSSYDDVKKVKEFLSLQLAKPINKDNSMNYDVNNTNVHLPKIAPDPAAGLPK